MRLVRDAAGKGHSAITAYPGSPVIVSRMKRATDRMVLVEKLPKEADALRAALGRQRLVSVIEGDGYAALKAHLPPRENRGLVLIDPPYESDLEFDRVLAGLELAHERWPTGSSASGIRSPIAPGRCVSTASSSVRGSARCSTCRSASCRRTPRSA